MLGRAFGPAGRWAHSPSKEPSAHPRFALFCSLWPSLFLVLLSSAAAVRFSTDVRWDESLRACRAAYAHLSFFHLFSGSLAGFGWRVVRWTSLGLVVGRWFSFSLLSSLAFSLHVACSVAFFVRKVRSVRWSTSWKIGVESINQSLLLMSL